MSSIEKEAKRKAKEGDFRGAGDLYASAGSLEKAFDMYTQAKDWLQAAKVCEKAGRPHDAAIQYIRAGEFALAGNCYRILREHGKAAHMYGKSGRHELAAEMYEAIGEYRQAGEAYAKADRWDSAGEMFEKAGDIERAGEAYEAKGSWLKASRCFEDAKGFRKAAEMAEKAEDWKRAGRCYQLAEDPLAAADRYRQAGDSAEALRVARSVPEDSPRYVEAMRRVFQALAERRYLTPLDEKQLARFGERPIDEENAQAFCDMLALYVACEMDEEAENLASRIREEAADLPAVAVSLGSFEAQSSRTSVESIEQILKESFAYEETTRRLEQRRGQREDEQGLDERDGVRERLQDLLGTKGLEEDMETREGARPVLADLAAERGSTDMTTALGRSIPAATRPGALGETTEAPTPRKTVQIQASHPTTVFSDGSEQATAPSRAIVLEDLKSGFLFDHRYLIARKLGSGGLGSVYLAQDEKLEEAVALKVLKPGFEMADNILFRFKQEIRLTRKIVHPNVVRTYDFGECGSLRYVSMEYIEGKDLKAILRENGRLPLRAGLEVAKDVCDALHAAHKVGITHRDIKPQNILVDLKGHVKVIDFGIAKMKDSVGATLTEMFVGTPDYISPEMAIGKPIDHRTDIYALGVVIFELFCGKTPFGGGPLVSVLSRHIHEAPTPPRDLDPSIPEWVERIVLKALAKDPAERHQTILDLKAEIVAGEKGAA